MKKLINGFLIAFMAFAATSCSEETPGTRELAGDAELLILPEVKGVAGMAETRAAVTGNTFGLGAQVGLRLKSSAKTLPDIYNNFYASYNGTWRYFLSGINTGTTLSGFSDWGTVTVMGYYPYDGNVTNFSTIPFSIASLEGGMGKTTKEQATIDYMVAAPKTKTMDQSGSKVTLEFEHLMTYIYLYITRTYPGPALTLQKVTLEVNKNVFTIAGMYNATNPNIDDPNIILQNTVTKKLEITTNQAIGTSNGSNVTIPLVIMPQLVNTDEDATFTATFHFVDADGDPFPFDKEADPKITYKLSQIGNDAGFVRGKQYRLTATIGTYNHLEGGPVVQERPMDEDTDPEHIDI